MSFCLFIAKKMNTVTLTSQKLFLKWTQITNSLCMIHKWWLLQSQLPTPSISCVWHLTLFIMYLVPVKPKAPASYLLNPGAKGLTCTNYAVNCPAWPVCRSESNHHSCEILSYRQNWTTNCSNSCLTSDLAEVKSKPLNLSLELRNSIYLYPRRWLLWIVNPVCLVLHLSPPALKSQEGDLEGKLHKVALWKI